MDDPATKLEQPERLAAIAASDLLDTGAIPALDRVVRTAATLLDVPVAQLNVVTADRQIPVSHVGGDRWGHAVSLDRSYCQHAIHSGVPLVVEDAREHAEVSSSVATGESGIIGYMSVPILSPRAVTPLATLCVVDFRRRDWGERDLSVLSDLAGWALSEIELRAAQRQIQRHAEAAVQQAELRARSTEERFRAIVEQGPAAIAVFEGPDHVYTLVSPMYERWAGGGPLRGRTFAEALPALRGSVFDRAHQEVYGSGEPATVHEARVEVDRDGDGVPEEYVFTVYYTALRDRAGSVYGVASLVVDLTEQVRARKELEIAREAAVAANRAKSDFLAIMSHELRTPLNAIGGYAELIEMGIRGPVTAEQREDLNRIQQSQRHLLGLINEVLNFAKLESGAARFDVEEIEMFPAINAAVSLVAPQATAKGLTLDASPCGTGLQVRADPDKLRQIILNLLSNAIKFSERGGAIVVACDSDSGTVRLAVRDTGIGIPAAQLERVFEPFVQVRADLTRTSEGTGLGLAISRDLARAMGGDLVVASELGVGSTFTLTLPSGAV